MIFDMLTSVSEEEIIEILNKARKTIIEGTHEKAKRSDEETLVKAQDDYEDGEGEDFSSEEDGPEESETQGKGSKQEAYQAPRQKEKIKEMDPERLKSLKGIAGHWLNHADQIRKFSAEAKKNPHLFGEGHRISAHNSAHEGFHNAHQELLNSDEYKSLSPAKQMRKELQFKDEWNEKNPDHLKDAANAVGEAHGMHAKAKDKHANENANRRAHVLVGGQGSSEPTFGAQEAAQHVGSGKDDSGMYTASVTQDPAASFAAANSDYLATRHKPKTVEDYEELEGPEAKAIKHPSLNDPANKKMLNDFFKDHNSLIVKGVNKARRQAQDAGIPESSIDVSSLHEAGMHGLMQALRDHAPEVGSFRTHAASKINGLMQSHLSSHDPVPRDMRAQAKFYEKHKDADWKQEAPAPEVPSKVEAVSAAPKTAASSAAPASAPTTEAPKVDVHKVISESGHPEAANMADRAKRVIIRKKGTT